MKFHIVINSSRALTVESLLEVLSKYGTQHNNVYLNLNIEVYNKFALQNCN
jgi:hypothetical protein